MNKRQLFILLAGASCALFAYADPGPYGGQREAIAARAASDAFARARVSTPFTVFNSKNVGTKRIIFWDQVTNATATIAYNADSSCVDLDVAADGDYAIRQTKQRWQYQPGKSQEILVTGILGDSSTGVTARLGYYNSATNAPYTNTLDGIFWESQGTDVWVVVANNGTENRIHRSDWNIDKMDGSGPTGYDLDFDAAQIYFTDFEWLGIGRVRVGQVVDGAVFYTHEFYHAGNISNVYARSPNHSIRYEIRSTGGAGSVKEICSSVISEGGRDPSGPIVSVGIPITNAVSVSTAPEAVLGVRLNTDHLDAFLDIESVSALTAVNNGNFHWFLCGEPTFGGTAVTWQDAPGEVAEFAIGEGDNIVTDFGVIITQGYAANDVSSITADVNSSLSVGARIDGDLTELWLVIEQTGSGNVFGSLTWQEFP